MPIDLSNYSMRIQILALIAISILALLICCVVFAILFHFSKILLVIIVNIYENVVSAIKRMLRFLKRR